jgi:hypothetical protein
LERDGGRRQVFPVKRGGKIGSISKIEPISLLRNCRQENNPRFRRLRNKGKEGEKGGQHFGSGVKVAVAVVVYRDGLVNVPHPGMLIQNLLPVKGFVPLGNLLIQGGVEGD